MLFRLLILIIALHPWCVIAQDSLESIAAIRALPPEAAGQSIPASIEAVVTFINPGRLLVHDGQDGLYVEAKSGLPPGVRFGSRVKLEGVTASGGFSILQAHAIQMQGTYAAPAPLQVDGANFLAPTMDCQWVELNAVITGTRTAGHRQLLVAEMGGWPFIINFPDDVPVQPHLAGLLQKEVSIRGTIGTVFNSQRQLTGRFSGALQDLCLDIELLARHQIKLGKDAGEQDTRVLLDVSRRTGSQEAAQAGTEVFKGSGVEHRIHRSAKGLAGSRV